MSFFSSFSKHLFFSLDWVSFAFFGQSRDFFFFKDKRQKNSLSGPLFFLHLTANGLCCFSSPQRRRVQQQRPVGQHEQSQQQHEQPQQQLEQQRLLPFILRARQSASVFFVFNVVACFRRSPFPPWSRIFTFSK